MTDATLSQIIHDWHHAPYGQKTGTINRWADALNVERKKIYRAIQKRVGRKKKERADKGKRMNPEIENHTKIIWGIKNRPPKDCGVIATDQAITIAVRSGAIPPEAALVHESTYNRIARETNLNHTKGRYRRNQAKYANLKHVFDASTSKYFYIDRRTPDGQDYILKLHTPSQNYKNKPIPCDRLRPWFYGVVDDHSGMLYVECVASTGESAAEAILFMQNAWSRRENAEGLAGLPKLLYLDLGPAAKAPAVEEFFNLLDIKMIKGMPGNSKARGKIERPWRTMWNRFEKPFFVLGGSSDMAVGPAHWKKVEISLSEYNRQLQNCLVEYNSWPHRYWKDLSRKQVWWNSINERGGLVDIPREAFKTVFCRHRRKVEGGYFSLDNKLYEVAGFDNGWVHVYEGVFDDRLVAECIKTNRKYEVNLFVPQTFGQKIALVKSKAEALAEESREKITISESFYQTAPDTIRKLPVRGEIKEIDDPLTVEPVIAPSESGNGPGNMPFFETHGDRYEHLIKLRAQGDTLKDIDIEFMTEFEQTDIYKQLAGTFKKWENFYAKRAIAGGTYEG